ncbi:hypothetical protein NDU88_003708 [Pleurodeles waltl]|uniref:Uncharacterized protein n=1 Tax=Pleurodeles waltl TaxID=8319 RepID=A0AAV7TPG1_PLEWA|nr:hypothetical protein NDU88_003708 [Pleurodeles waltl]
MKQCVTVADAPQVTFSVQRYHFRPALKRAMVKDGGIGIVLFRYLPNKLRSLLRNFVSYLHQQNIPSSKSLALGSCRPTLDLDACAAHAVVGSSFYNKFFRKSHHRIGLLYLYSNTLLRSYRQRHRETPSNLGFQLEEGRCHRETSSNLGDQPEEGDWEER